MVHLEGYFSRFFLHIVMYIDAFLKLQLKDKTQIKLKTNFKIKMQKKMLYISTCLHILKFFYIVIESSDSEIASWTYFSYIYYTYNIQYVLNYVYYKLRYGYRKR